MSILFAIGSLICAAANDLVFKRYARKPRSIGIYVALVGLIWTAVFTFKASPSSFEHLQPATLWWGIAAGVFSVVSNILLIEAMRHHEAGICATIYRLNLAPAAILAFIFLGEQVSMWKVLGILAAAGSVLLFFLPNHSTKTHVRHSLPMALVAASLLRAGMGISYKVGISSGADASQFLAINGVLWLVGGLIYAFWLESHPRTFSLPIFGYGFFSGALVCGIALFMMLALQRGDASAILPVTQLSFLVTGILGTLFLREAFTRRKVAGWILAGICIIFMSFSA
ncbi:MAG: EamA family transporter [Verrucomicrobiae bacterium]|nr:EamA family transporter [Verrucomicrobiae bacterium]